MPLLATFISFSNVIASFAYTFQYTAPGFKPTTTQLWVRNVDTIISGSVSNPENSPEDVVCLDASDLPVSLCGFRVDVTVLWSGQSLSRLLQVSIYYVLSSCNLFVLKRLSTYCPSLCLSVHLCVYLSIYVSVCPSMRLSAHLCVCLSIYVLICLWPSCVCVWLSCWCYCPLKRTKP